MKNQNKIWRWMFPLILGLVTFLLNVNTFGGNFVYDDIDVIVNDSLVREGNFFDLSLWRVWSRSTRTISLMIDYRIFGDSSAGYHYQNILWHLLSILLIYGIFKKLSRDTTLSFVGALFFAVHPIHVEAVANISNRKESLCMFFSLISFYQYIRFVEQNKKRWIHFLICVLGWYLALNSKQVAIVLPISIIAYEYIFLSKERRFLTKSPIVLIFITVAGIAFYAYTVYNLDIKKLYTLTGFRGNTSKFNIIVNSALSFWIYVKLLFFPFGLSPDYVLVLPSSLSPSIIISWVLLIGIIPLALYFGRRKPLLSFGLFWFLINYIPISNLMPSAYIIADRYMYIPSVGYCLVFATIWTDLNTSSQPSNKNFIIMVQVVALLLILTIFSLKTVNYNSVWLNEKSLWDYTVEVTPASYKAYYNRGSVYSKLGDYRRALKDLSKAIELNPMYADAHYSRGTVYYSLGDYKRAIEDLSMAIELKTRHFEKAYNNRGIAYHSLGQYRQAISDFNKAIELNSQDELAYSNRGNAYFRIEDYQQAINDYDKAIDINPRHVDAYNNRGYVYYILGNTEHSINDLKRAIELDPEYVEAYDNLGMVYSRIGNNALALDYYRKAASLGSKEAQEYLNKESINK